MAPLEIVKIKSYFIIFKNYFFFRLMELELLKKLIHRGDFLELKFGMLMIIIRIILMRCFIRLLRKLKKYLVILNILKNN